MSTPTLLTKINIPESLLIGKGEFTVLECKNKEIYKEIEQTFRGSLFHLKYKGKFYVKVDRQTLKELKPYIAND